MTVAVAATLLTLVIGVVVGAIAGYAGGRIDGLIMRFVDAMYAFPDLLFVILVSALVRGQLSGEPTGWLGSPPSSTGHPAASFRSSSPSG